MMPEIASSSVSVSQNEQLFDAQSEREALESALLTRKITLEAELEALTLGKVMHKEMIPNCDATGRHVARCHRDFLLQEMEWMAADFNQERKWRVRNAKTLSQALVSHLNRQEDRLARQKKSQETAKRRRAARIGREVKKFWVKIDKIIAFKVKLEADEMKQKQMEKQLLQLVHQTEKYAMALAASFQEEENEKRHEEENGEFQLEEEGDDDDDDEDSIEEEEKKNGVMSKRQVALEMKMLQEEGDMSVDELKAKYADMKEECEEEVMDVDSAGSNEDGDFQVDEEEEDDERSIAEEEKKVEYAGVLAVNDEALVVFEGGDAKKVEEENDDEDVVDGEFDPTKCDEEDQADDKTTIEGEERLGRDASLVSRAEELRLLEEEGNMSIDQLRARYATVSDDKESSSDKNGSARSDEEHDSIETSYRKQKCLKDGNTKELVDASTCVPPVARKSGYKRPYLLTSRLDLREYQEAGVNWLVSMCERRINGILADEMGLGKTIQTISLLAHLACTQGLWGPHLIVVPTSCLVNWEMEFKRWCPAFKVLTYFGSAKRRKELRQGWSKQNAFQVCITSYQLVVQDAHCFKRKKWYYLILDEAHNIKNWKSLRWQTLLTFSSQRRLLLTGTPLQNNVLELWALMHFLMPSDPAQSGDNGVEGGKDLVAQLHGIIRPFVLRRLKKDVAKQLPGKFEHVITCQLSRRQRFLYEDFISRSATRRAMFGRGKGRGANFMSMMNVLMQLRKVCNHPDLFEPRPIASPLDMPGIHVHVPSRCGYLVDEIVNERPRVALWADNNLPGLELLLSEKCTSKRRRELFFYDVSAPLPDDTVAIVPSAYESKQDIVRRIIRLAAKRRKYWEKKRASIAQLQKLCVGLYLDEPVFGSALIRACTMPTFISPAMEVHMHRAQPFLDSRHPTLALQDMVRDPEERLASLQSIVNKSVCYVPKARAMPARIIYGGGGFVYDDNFVLSRKAQAEELGLNHAEPVAHRMVAPYHNSFKRTQLFFPDKALVQFDCGKLQQLAVLLRTLKRGGHRCLIFTQMSSMLNILEVFLNLHGHTYFRLDGATKVEKRQMLMERFNRDDKIFCFILSTRSGGLGINLTGADAVIFYDSDWNPAMDAQAQDRAHRIGQTRDVHIYRLKGQFTTDFFSKASLRELMAGSLGEEPEDIESKPEVDDESTDEDMEDDTDLSLDTVERAMAQLEDEEDVVAMEGARAEYLREQHEFDEDVGGGGSVASPSAKVSTSRVGDTVSSRPSTPLSVSISTVASERGDGEDEEFGNENTADEGTTEEVYNQLSKTEGMRDFDGLEPGESMGYDKQTDKARRKRQRSNTGDQNKMKKRLKFLKPPNENGKHGEKVRERARDAAEEQKLQAWKASVQSLQGFEDSLNSVDRYALHFREDVDPLYTYTLAQQAAALARIDPNPPASTLLEDIEQTEVKKREEEARLIAEGELVVGQMDDNDDIFLEERTEHYTELYRRERARVLFEQRKRLLTGEAWSLMKCAKTGQPFYFNADTREATWECPPVWMANEQLKNARRRGYEGLPPPALLRVLSMLNPFPERHRAQMVCRSWHTAAQHHSLFVKISASDFDTGSLEVFGKELQMHSCHAQLRWSARGGVIRGFHFTRFNGASKSAVPDVKPSSDATESVPAIKESRRALRNHDKRLGNWQNLLRVVGDGQLRVEYCEFDGNGLGNACICVWGHGEKKKKKKKRKRETADIEAICVLNPSTPLVATSVSSTLTTSTAWVTTTPVSTSAGTTAFAFKTVASLGAPSSVSDATKSAVSTTVAPVTTMACGSSGVLLMRGSLVMSLNTVEGNAHSGVTILGGQALLRRNKVQRNARFGLRLLYHAGNVIVEDNAVFGNACGNLDVDNSGRRFVVRLNDMDKGKTSSRKLPHFHGKLRLKTYRMLEKEVPCVSVQDAKPVNNAATEYWKRQVAVGAAASIVSPAMPTASSAATSTRPANTASSIMRAGIPMGFMRPVVIPQGSNPLHVSHLPMAFASLGARPTIPSMTLNRPTMSAQLPTTRLNLQRSVSALGTASSVPTRPGILTTTAPTTIHATSSIEPQQQRQKRRPKTQQLIVGGREILLRDTCEKPTEKVVKPRRSRDQLTPVVGSTGLQRITLPSPLQLKFAPGSTAAAIAAAMSAMMANTAKLQAAALQVQTGVRFGNTVTTKTPVAMASTVGVKAVTPTPVATKSSTLTAATKPTAAVTPNVGTKVATPVAKIPLLKAMAPQSIKLLKQSAKPGEERKLETARMETNSTGQEGKKSFGEADSEPGNKISKP
ncbi:unnamed protein product [Peronospora destructor]|uniref:Protein PHOTOPERIOD-INDEPENDENT EARLY FLOWERING 1 n=1 Tax=Peronospora destructor TaxID=86335 RepID=A0AAV0U472_9STRA|nr:unnamed protein product [Peronospora destructor]